MTVVAESEALHDRVCSLAAGAPSAEGFDALALALADFQARWSPGYRRLVERRGTPPRTADDVPAVPVAAFRGTRVAVHPAELDEVRFETSGTTGEQRGVHAMRTTRTYRALSSRFGRRALLPPDVERAVVVALAPVPARPPASSLSFMLQTFMADFDGRGIELPLFDAHAAERWLVRDGAVDVAGLERAAAVARERREPLIVLGTSLALLALLEQSPALRVKTPERTRVMQTGGFKGRVHAADPETLRRDVGRVFGIDPAQVVAEYGMTELTSQLYEVGPGSYAPPHWLRVSAVDPVTLERVPSGEVGLARFVDLGNVDSAVAIVTEDLIREHDAGVELLGRRPGAPARGCSLALESLLLEGPRS